jgi:hypothetical protein
VINHDAGNKTLNQARHARRPHPVPAALELPRRPSGRQSHLQRPESTMHLPDRLGTAAWFVNAIIKPLLIVLTLPLTLLTFGLFVLVINALMILLVW